MTQTTQTNHPDDRCEQIAREIIPPWDPYCHELQSKVASALQAKQDEMDALREEVLGVIEPFANIGSTVRASEYGRALRKSEMVEAQLEYYLAAKSLRDKLKASQPTLPQPQTPHQ